MCSFLRIVLNVVGVIALSGWMNILAQPSTEPDREVLRVGFVVSADDSLANAHDSALRGVKLGTREVTRVADLLGKEFEVVTTRANTKENVEKTARRIIAENNVFALVGGFDTPTCAALGKVAAGHDVLYFNVGCSDDALRGSGCRPTTFHIGPSAAMAQDAIPTDAPSDYTVSAWHSDLFRYGAKQLNQRFEDTFGDVMDSPAWTSWLAIKILWEANQRTQTTEAAPLIKFLEGDQAKFDGHKGRPLTFRSWNHQLRQPLYLIQAEGNSSQVVQEVPEPRNNEPRTSKAVLDQIGVDRMASTCEY